MPTPTILLLATGGTIASTHTDSPHGVSPTKTGHDLLREAYRTQFPPPVDCCVRAVLQKDSSQFTWDDRDVVATALWDAIEEENRSWAGIVVLHGTDTAEMTALWLTLVAEWYWQCHPHTPRIPIVLTGAAFPADSPSSDGPANLRRAISSIVNHETPASCPVSVVMGDCRWAPWGLTKWTTESARAFTGPTLTEDSTSLPPPLVSLLSTPPPVFSSATSSPLQPPRLGAAVAAGARTLTVSCQVEEDAQLLASALDSLDSSPTLLLLEGLGSGNIPASCAQVLCPIDGNLAVPDNTVVVMTSRVPCGPVAALYDGPGGGARLASAGVLMSSVLRAPQLRVLFMALQAAGYPPRILDTLLSPPHPPVGHGTIPVANQGNQEDPRA